MRRPFDETHKRLFTFDLDAEKEIVNLRAIVQGMPPRVETGEIAKGGADPAAAQESTTPIWAQGAEQRRRSMRARSCSPAT